MEELQRPSANGVKTSVSTSLGTGSNLQLDTRPIVWAVDAFPEEAALHQKTASVLQNVFPFAPIHPIYVLSEESFTDRGFSNFLRPALKPMAIKALKALLSDIHVSNMQKPRVLIESSTSLSSCAYRLLRYAKRISAGAIAIGSHGRRGFARFFVGSFSEVILDHSPVPVLMAGPRTSLLTKTPSTIVFPTDFSPICWSAYEDVLRLASTLNAEIHLFHKTIHPVDPIVQSGVNIFGGGWVSVEAYMNQPPEDHETDAEVWIRRAQENGVTARYINENFREPTSEAIVQYVRNLNEAPALLAMVSQSGPVASALLGSITRDVIRESPCPVYLTPRTDHI